MFALAAATSPKSTPLGGTFWTSLFDSLLLKPIKLYLKRFGNDDVTPGLMGHYLFAMVTGIHSRCGVYVEDDDIVGLADIDNGS